MRPLRSPWTLYALFLALGLGAMGWITILALRSEVAERQAQARAMTEEKIRLALWRMDSTMALFISPEAARPWYHFETFHAQGGVRVPSPMLMVDDPMVLLRFQVDATGRFTSPLVPSAADEPLARQIVQDPLRLEQASSRLVAVQGFLAWASLRRTLATQGAVLLSREEMGQLRARAARSGARLASPFEVNHGAWVPFWKSGDLLMARQVWVGDQELIQGLWLDWPAVKEVLMSTLRSTLPKADLEPATDPRPGEKDRRMGSLPVKLQPGAMTAPMAEGRSPARAALLLGWGFALLGAVAGGLVLRHALELSERRGAFASAVTHELRTPLTTFRLYTELLAKGMVTDPEEQHFLLNTLLEEADRLDHLVKNVLAFARLESRREGSLEALTVEALLDRPLARLRERAAQAGLSLEVALPDPLREIQLRTDPLVVEQVLFNLVDNAAKYAAGTRDPRIHLEVEAREGQVIVRVRDHGPGIDAADRRHLFRPFHKSAQKAARSAPGVGLGLALCRKLARSLGGDLDLDPETESGAAFLVTLPRP